MNEQGIVTADCDDDLTNREYEKRLWTATKILDALRNQTANREVIVWQKNSRVESTSREWVLQEVPVAQK
jgi:hypothetical protein